MTRPAGGRHPADLDPRCAPGARWVPTTRKDSPRTIHREGRGPHEGDGMGIWFTTNGGTLVWASDRAWERWIDRTGATCDGDNP